MGFLSKLFGRKTGADWTEIADEKRAHFAKHLGEPTDSVIFSPLPFQFGGMVNLWVFPNKIPGAILTTMQLVAPGRTDQKKGPLGKYELAMAVKEDLSTVEQLQAESDNPDSSLNLVRRLITAISGYSQMAVLQPGETAELPTEDPEEPSIYLLFDTIIKPDNATLIGNDTLALLLIMKITKQDFVYKETHGGEALIKQLKEAKRYPYTQASQSQ
tara:strand:+ start:2144 stop:2788 length:645 start_codon:yes stop_codon:yes gene_type:complete